MISTSDVLERRASDLSGAGREGGGGVEGGGRERCGGGEGAHVEFKNLGIGVYVFTLTA